MTVEAKTIQSVGDYVREYEFRGDGGDYIPSEGERLLIEDAIHGFISAAPASPPAETGEGEPTCQACGGEIAGWLCQTCDKEFKENDAGRLIFTDEADFAQPVSPSEGEAITRQFVASVLDRWVDWCAYNEAEFTGWGDGEVPEGAETWTINAKAARALIANDAPRYTHPASDQSDTERMRAALEGLEDILADAETRAATRWDQESPDHAWRPGLLAEVNAVYQACATARAALAEKAADK